MFCPNCGTQLPEGSKFCAGCGNPLAAPEAQQPQAPVWPEPTLEPPPVGPVIPEAPQKPVRPEKPRKKSKLPVILALVLVVALVAAALWFFVFNAKKTVYLLESQESTTYGAALGTPYTSTTITEFEYDEDGRILSYSTENQVAYGGDDSVSSSGTEIEYEYDEDGRLIAAELELNGETIEMEYHYDDDGMLEKVTGEVDGGESEVKATCNEDGLIESVKLYDADGEEVSHSTYEYDDDGNLEKAEKNYGFYLISCRYENNKMVEMTQEQDGEINARYVYAYNERGRMTEQTVYGPDEMLMSSMKLEYVYEDDKLMELEITMKNEEETLGKMTGEVEWDGLEATIPLTGENLFNSSGDTIPDNTYVYLEYDEHGNLLKAEFYMDDELFMEYNYSYVEVKVPKDYVEFWAADPYWMNTF